MEDTKTKAKSKNSRARRLSYVANAEGVGPQVQSSSCLVSSNLAAPACIFHRESTSPLCQQRDLLQPSLGGESASVADKAKPAAVNITATPTIPPSSDKPRAPAQSSNTRARRLSYVTNDVSAFHCIASSCMYLSVNSSKLNSVSHKAHLPEPTLTFYRAWLLALLILYHTLQLLHHTIQSTLLSQTRHALATS